MIDWNQQSTKRGAVWLIGGVTAMVFSFVGKDPTQVLAITAAMAGGMGFTVSDTEPKQTILITEEKKPDDKI
jgi:hypothetical protein